MNLPPRFVSVETIRLTLHNIPFLGFEDEDEDEMESNKEGR